MTIPEATDSGRIPFREWETWYRITGAREGGATPLVILHGGPGAAHNYTLTMARLSEQGRAVVQYDQLGTGNSTHLREKGADFWTVELFLEELDNLLQGLDLTGGYHLLGHSWGGMLAAEHAVRRPQGLRSLLICDSPASMQLWMSETAKLAALLPEDIQDTLRMHEREGNFQGPEYENAIKVFYDRHVCRVVPNPAEVTATFQAIADDPTVYTTMNGPSEFHVTGTLREWSVIDRLDQVKVPTLLINGAYDEATDPVMQPFYDRIHDVRWERFQHSSHMPHVEEEDRFMEVVGTFLAEHD